MSHGPEFPDSEFPDTEFLGANPPIASIPIDEQDDRALGRRATSGAMWISLESMGVQGTSFAVFAVLAHLVSATDVGLMNISYAVIFSLKSLLLENLVAAVSLKQDPRDEDYTTCFWLTFPVAFVAALGIVAIAPLAEHLLGAPGLTPVLRKMSLMLVFVGLVRTHESWLWRNFKFRSLAMRGIVGAVIGGIAGIVMAMRGWGVEALIAQQIIGNIASLVLLWISCPWRPTLAFSRSSARHILGFMSRMLPTSIVEAANQNGDVFLVTVFFGTAGAGFYGVAKRILFAVNMVATTPITTVTTVTFANIQSDLPRVQSVFLKGSLVTTLISAPIFFGLSAVAPYAIELICGNKWLLAAPTLSILAVAGLGSVVLRFNDGIFITQKRPLWTVYVSGSYAVCSILAFLLLSRLGSTQVALPFVVPYLAVIPWSLFLLRRLIGLPLLDWCRVVFPALASSIVMLVSLRLIDAQLPAVSDLVHLAILCPLGAVIYALTLFVVSRKQALLAIVTGREMIQRRLVSRRQAA